MTLPALIQKQQEKVAVTRLKNIYSALAQAFNSAISEYGTIDNWCKIEYPDYPTFVATTEACSQIISDRVMPYLRVIKDCNKKTILSVLQKNVTQTEPGLIPGIHQKVLLFIRAWRFQSKPEMVITFHLYGVQVL